MKKMMLINASHEEERRVAIVLDDYLHELDIESGQKALTKGNIYKGTVTKVEPSLQAAFVEYGAARQGFLPLNEIHPDFWKEDADKMADPRKVNIQDVLERKQSVLIQVVKEERGNKGAALTTFISLAGRYLVLSPNTTRGGISRKLSDDARRAIKQILAQLNVPEHMGLIVRTAGKDQSLDSLQWDYQYLSRLWDEIRIKSDSAPAPSLIYLEGDLATRAIRDHFTDDIAEIWVDNHEMYTQTKHFVHAVLPGKEKLVKLYRGKKPLFRHYKIEQQCEEIHEREIRLASGGSIVFDPTEALTSIDVNSSRATGGKNIDETALETNLEAAAEVARQLRIRDIGGLVVIDFIDMSNRKHAQQVEEALRDATKGDKARIQLARISRFGLLEMSRQRLHPSVRESTSETCPRCQGRGSIRTVESMALQMLTRMEDWAEEGKKPVLVVQVPSDTGEYLMNSKRDRIDRIESIYDVQINLQIKPDLDIPHYRIERQWTDDNNQQRIEVLEDTGKNKRQQRAGRKLRPLKPVVGVPKPIRSESNSTSKEQKKSGLLAWLAKLFGSNKKTAEAEAEPEIKKRRPQRRRNRKKPTGQNGNQRQKQSQRSNQKQGKKTQHNNARPEHSKQDNTNSNTEVAGQNNTQDGQQKRRRRRRRRPSQKQEQTQQNNGVQTPDNANNEVATAETTVKSATSGSSSDTGKTDQQDGKTERKPRRNRTRRRKTNNTQEVNADNNTEKQQTSTSDKTASSEAPETIAKEGKAHKKSENTAEEPVKKRAREEKPSEAKTVQAKTTETPNDNISNKPVKNKKTDSDTANKDITD